MARRIDNLSPNSLKSQPFMKNLLRSFKGISVQAIKNNNPVLADLYSNNKEYVKVPTRKNEFSEVEKEPVLRRAKEYLNKNIEDIRDGTINEKTNLGNNISPSNPINKKQYSFMDDISNTVGNPTSEYNSEFTQNIVVNTNLHSKALIHTIHDVVSAMSRTHLQGSSSIALHINSINKFNNDVTVNYYNDISNYTSIMNSSLNSIAGNIEKQANIRQASLKSGAYSFELSTVIESQQLLSLDYISKQVTKGISDNLMISVDDAKMMMDTVVSNPIGFLIKEFDAVGKLIPEDIKKSLNSFNNATSSIGDSLLMNLKDMQKSRNPFLKQVGDLFGPEDSGRSKVALSSYSKGKVAYDGVTKKAIVNVIPTLLSKILTEVDPKNHSKELSYDYEKGGFTTIDNMKEYMSRYDNLNRKPESVKDAKKLKKLIKDKINDINRFSSETTYGLEYGTSSSSNKSKKKSLKDFFNRNKDVHPDDTNEIKSSNKMVQFISSNIDKGSNWIDKIFFGTNTLNESADMAINSAFGLLNNNMKDNNKVDAKGLFGSINDKYFKPMLNWLKGNYDKFESFVKEKVWSPITSVANTMKNDVINKLKSSKANNDGILGQALDEGLFKGIKEMANAFVKKPMLEKWKNFKDMMGSKLSSRIQNISKLLLDATNKIKNKRTPLEGGNLPTRIDILNAPPTNDIVGDDIREEENSNAYNSPIGPTEDPINKSFNSVIKSLGGAKVRINRVSKIVKSTTKDISQTYNIMRTNYKNSKDIDTTLSSFYSSYLSKHNKSEEEDNDENDKKENKFKAMITKWFNNTLLDVKFLMNEAKDGGMISKLAKSGMLAIGKFTEGAFKTVGTTIKSVGTMATGITKLGLGTMDIVLKCTKNVAQSAAPAMHNMFSKTLPNVLSLFGNFLGNSIETAGKVITKATVGMLKLSGNILVGTMKIASWGISKISGGIGKMLGKTDIGKKTPTVHANVLSGNLDGILQPINIYQNKKKTIQDKWSEEDADDSNDSLNVESNAKNSKDKISSRISDRTGRIKDMASKVIGMGVNMMSTLGYSILGTGLGTSITSGIGSVISKVKGSKAGGFLSKHMKNGKFSNAQKVYIVGGSLDDGGINGDDNDGGIVDNVIDTVTGKGGKKGKGKGGKLSGAKGLLSKVKNIAGSKGGKIAGGALLATGAAGITSKVVSKAKEKKEERTTRLEEKREAAKKSKVSKKITPPPVTKTAVNPLDEETVGVKSRFGDFPNVTAQEMVTMYRKFKESENNSEKELYKKLSSQERITFDSTKSMMQITAAETGGKKQASFGDMFKKFAKGFSLGGILGGAFGLLFNGAKALWDGVKTVGKGLMNFIKNPIQSIKNFGSSLVSSLFGKKKNKNKGNSSSGGSNNSGGTNNDITNSPTGGNIQWPSGSMSLGDKIILYGKAFLGKIKYSQDLRTKINNQGDRADCSSYVNHIYTRTAGIDVGSTTAQQQDSGQRIKNKADLIKGDLVFFYGSQGAGRNGIGHVGIYEGDGKYIHTGGPSSGYNDAKVGDLSNNSKFAWGQRIINSSQKVDSVVKNPNTALTGITETVSTAANQQGTANARSGGGGSGEPAINDNDAKSNSRTSDPPTDKESTASPKQARTGGNQNSKPVVTNTFMTNMAPSYVNAKSKKESAAAPKKLTKDNSKCTTSECKMPVRNTDYSSNWSGLRTVRRNRGSIYNVQNPTASLYECMVDVLTELDSNTETMKDKEYVVQVGNNGNIFLNAGDNSEINGFNKIYDISNSTQLIASGI